MCDANPRLPHLTRISCTNLAAVQLRVVVFPQAVLRLNSLLTNFVIDDVHHGAPTTPGSCDNAFVYLSDTTAPGLVVYDVQRDSAWRISHPSMFPSPDHGTYRARHLIDFPFFSPAV